MIAVESSCTGRRGARAVRGKVALPPANAATSTRPQHGPDRNNPQCKAAAQCRYDAELCASSIRMLSHALRSAATVIKLLPRLTWWRATRLMVVRCAMLCMVADVSEFEI